jgi:hypothetical protein
MRDLDELFTALQQNPFRRRQTLTGKDLAYLQRRGLETVLQHAADLVARRLAIAQPANDGKQTPWHGHPVFTAQHATATCCRGCLAKWHAIEQGRALTDEERRYIVEVIGRWLGPRLAGDP